MFDNLKKNFQIYSVGLLFFFVVIIWHSVFSEKVGLLRVSVLNVGQGDAIHIKSPGGADILVDGGPDRSVLRALGSAMPFYDRSIDLILVSNPDKDHISGLLGVFDTFDIGAVMIPGTDPNTDVYRSFLSAVNEEGAYLIEARRGGIVDLGGGARFEIIFPDRDPSGLDTNTGSLVARLVFGNTAMMFTGDMPSGVEEYLVRIDSQSLKSDLIKVGHHGSKTSSSRSFIGFVAPSTAVISVGANNSYGHPNKETLEIFGDFGVEVFRTDLDGTIQFFSDGKKFWHVGR